MIAGASYRTDFPLLRREEHSEYVYMDSAATTLKPDGVVDAVQEYYGGYTANVHRSVHRLAERATIAFEAVREGVAGFIKADRNEVIFTHNCTDAINLAAELLGLSDADEAIVSSLEHHSNYLPWRARCRVHAIGVGPDGRIDLEQLERAITPRTRVIAVTWVSNVTGNVQPVHEVVRLARRRGVCTLIDGAQAIGHFPVDVGALGCDFLAFSAHKMLGPTGVGVLYARQDRLADLKPRRLGGGMVNKVTSSSYTLKEAPYCFEPGTPNIEGVIAFGGAIDYFQGRGIERISAHLKGLERHFRARLLETDLIRVPFALHEEHAPIFSFVPGRGGIDLNHFGRILSDTFGIAVSVGVQCCQPFYQAHDLSGAVRASLHVYNTKDDIDRFFDALENLKMFL